MLIRTFSLRARSGGAALLLTLAGGFFAPFVPVAYAATATVDGTTELSPAPVNQTTVVPPNLALTFDDSGSMAEAFMPANQGADDRSDKCSWTYAYYGSNHLYYDPSVTYDPPLNADGTSFASTLVSFTSAPLDGYSAYTGNGTQKTDLSKSYIPTYTWDSQKDGSNTTIGSSCVPSGAKSGSGGNKKYHAYYYTSSGTLVDLTTITTGATVGDKTRTIAEEQQNFANWYSYYRTRNLMAKTAVTKVFGSLKTPIQLVWQTIWPHSSSRSWSSSLVPGTTKIAPLEDTYKQQFFSWLYALRSYNGTPDREATQRAGEFFAQSLTKTDKDPYWNRKTGAESKDLTCRLNFHVLVTDGYWNGTDSDVSTPAKTADAMSQTPDGRAEKIDQSKVHYNMDNTFTKSLANIAYNYWATDLQPSLDDGVPKYLANSSHNLWPDAPYNAKDNWSNKEIYFNPENDPATWQHLTQFIVTLGVNGSLASPADLNALRLGNKSWPMPVHDSLSAIDDMWHAAIVSRGSYFSATDPQALATQLSNILANIGGRNQVPAVNAINASVLSAGAVSFNAGYNSDWSGILQAVTLNEDGTIASEIWNAASLLDSASTTPPDSRNILTASMDGDGKITGMPFRSTSAFDAAEQAGLNAPAATDTSNDTLQNRVDYLRGVRTQETNGVMRGRNSLLGAILNSQATYVSYPSSGYNSTWPAGSSEAADAAQTYDDFVSDNTNRVGTLYVGANDGMLHAFDASLVKNADGTYGPDQSATAGEERWAYVPRAVYGHLGNLTSLSSFKFAPTVDGTPVTRDVFFASDNKWHTILVGGLRLGGRGIYALDITDPDAVDEASAGSKVLWEFDADAPVVTDVGNPADLGYTFGQPNIGRLANGKWVVLIPSGYFPDCSYADKPSDCDTVAAQAPKDGDGKPYSALFVLDAQTGEMIAELKTPTDIDGVTSYGLSSPVLGDYDNDQIDDIAFAGDLAGNLWRFDLSSADSADWKVTLAYEGISDANGKQGVQPITVMPRLFPDPATNRFIVVFGTGKYLGAGDNTSDSTTATQSLYGIRDLLDDSGDPLTITHDTLQAQTLTEETVTDTDDPNYGATLRLQTSNAVSSTKGGWYSDLDLANATGERVVVTPGAFFSTNTAIINTVIPGNNDPCNPTVQGAAMLLDAATGGPGSGGVSSLGGFPYVGARVNNVRTSGTVPVATVIGGGKLVLPGLTLTGKKGGSGTGPDDAPFTGDAPIWRRRSWSELNNDQ